MTKSIRTSSTTFANKNSLFSLVWCVLCWADLTKTFGYAQPLEPILLVLRWCLLKLRCQGDHILFLSCPSLILHTRYIHARFVTWIKSSSLLQSVFVITMYFNKIFDYLDFSVYEYSKYGIRPISLLSLIDFICSGSFKKILHFAWFIFQQIQNSSNK